MALHADVPLTERSAAPRSRWQRGSAPTAPERDVDEVVRATGVSRAFDGRGVLHDIDLTIRRGEFVALLGRSGSGKSTLLRILARLDGDFTGTLEAPARPSVVFQSHYLLPEFTALENVAMPALIQRADRARTYAEARKLLERVGLGSRVDHRPGELSGGEAQRVALARALVLKPAILLADEPTGNLDPATGEGIHELLREVNRELGITAVVVTHNETLARSMPRRLRLAGGQVTDA